jgi:hypothetical protein
MPEYPWMTPLKKKKNVRGKRPRNKTKAVLVSLKKNQNTFTDKHYHGVCELKMRCGRLLEGVAKCKRFVPGGCCFPLDSGSAMS